MYRFGGDFGIAEAAWPRLVRLLYFFGGKEKETLGINVPGIMYVRLRRALSICDTCPAFFVMKSSYMASHCGGIERIWPTLGRGLWAAGAAGAGMLLLLGVVECRRRRFARGRGVRGKEEVTARDGFWCMPKGGGGDDGRGGWHSLSSALQLASTPMGPEPR